MIDLLKHQAKFIESKAPFTAIVGGYGCLPNYTEVLTRKGWIRIDEYQNQDILTSDIYGNTNFEKPLNYINQKAGNFLKFKTNHFEMEVTENHKVVYFTEKDKKHRFTEAIDLNKRVRIPLTFKAPNNVSGVDFTDEQIRVIIMVSADGYLQDGKAYVNLKKERKQLRGEQILKAANIPFSIHKSSDGYKRYYFNSIVNTKDLSIFWSANNEQLKIIFDEVKYWDSHVYKCGSLSFCGNKKNADFIQYVISTQNRGASIQKDNREYKKESIYNTRQYQHNYAGLRYCEIEKTQHEREYCFETLKGFFIARQNQNIFLTGNSGKTEGGLIKLLTYLIRNRVDVAYYLPTYNLVEDIALKKLPKILDKFDGFFNGGIDIRKKPYNIKTQYGDIMMRSMDNPDLIAGYEVGYSVIDEIDRMSLRRAEESFNSINARNRLPMPYDTNSIDFVCTPEGYSFLYNFFVKNGTESRVLIKAKTTDNKYLPEDYITRLTESYDEQRLKAYLNGEFVNFNNLNVYPLFDRDIHVQKFDNPIYKKFVGLDFNIGKMSAVVGTDVKGTIHIFKEYVNFYDTEAIIKQITDDFGKCFIFPDASGHSRKTSGNTDFEVIWRYKHEIVYSRGNPPVKDRIGALNKRFREKRILIDPICKNLITALEQQVLMENGQPDKTSGHDHILDALGYMVYGHFINS